MDNGLISQIVIMVVLIIMSAYFSATETAFSSLNKTRIKALAEKGNKKAKLTYTLSEQYDKLISTILIGNNIVNIALASIGTLLFIDLCGEEIGATVSTVVVTVAVLIFGEISPKSIAKDCPEAFAMFSAPLIRFFIVILTPLNFIFTNWKKLLSRILKIEKNDKMSQEELIMFVEEVEQEGSIDKTESDLIKNAIEFKDICAEDILTHRTSIVAVSVDASKEEIGDTFSESKFSRLLVYEESIDNIVGVLHQKNFYIDDGVSEKSVKELMTPPIFIRQTEKIDDLLRLLQKSKSHIAVVLDEFGGTHGIVTMEDILEELVGEIWDEHDEVVVSFKQIDDSTYEADGNAEMDEFCDLFSLEIESETVSLSGWVSDQLEKIPDKGDSFEYGNLRITVLESEAHRASKLKIQILEVSEGESEE